MAEEVPEEIRKDLKRARALHDRAVSDYDKCLEFNQLLSAVLVRLEDAGYDRTAGKVMTVLLDCHPKEGARCDRAQLVGEKVKRLEAP